MLTTLSASGLGHILPWSTSDLRHLIYFATFAAGLWAFHRLCRRWLGQGAAIAPRCSSPRSRSSGARLHQPERHPFQTAFVLTLVLGLEMVDVVGHRSEQVSATPIPTPLLLLTGIWLALLFGLTLSTPLAHAQIEGLVRSAAAGRVNIISRIATDIHTADPLLYIDKYFVWFIQGARSVPAGADRFGCLSLEQAAEFPGTLATLALRLWRLASVPRLGCWGPLQPCSWVSTPSASWAERRFPFCLRTGCCTCHHVRHVAVSVDRSNRTPR